MNTRRPRIALYQPYPHTFGGMHAIVLKLAKALPEHGFDPIIITPEEGSFTERLRCEELPYFVSNPGDAWHVYGRGASGLSYALSPGRLVQLGLYWRKLGRELRARDISILHCNDYRSVMLAAPAARLARVPSLWHMHGHVASRLLNLAAARLVTWSVPVSEGMLDYQKMPRWLLGKQQVIPNGLEPEFANTPASPPAGPPVVLALGTLHPRKGYETLLRAFRIVRQGVPGAECWIAGGEFGNGSHGRELRRLAVHYAVAGQVKFLGPSDDVAVLLQRATLLAIPSRVEVFGLVAVEAMLAGKPVVACRTGGLKDIVEHGRTGLLVEPGDSRAMGEAIVQVLNDAELAARLGRAGHERALTHFTLEKMTAAFAAFYRRLLADTRSMPEGLKVNSPQRTRGVVEGEGLNSEGVEHSRT